jgi:hypothetical protein
METAKKIQKSSGLEGAKKGSSKTKIIFRIVIFLLLAGSIGSSVYLYLNYKELKENPQTVAQDEVKKVTDAVSKLMELPQGEDANLATVLDKEKLKEQEFFKKAENGDKILIYVKAKKAILYRPSTKKIIEVAPLFLGGNQVQNQTQNQNQAQVQNQEENQSTDTE